METLYDEKEDILNIQLKKEGYWKSIELGNGIVLDINQEGEIIGIEILRASKVLTGDGKRVIKQAMVV